MTAPAYGTDLLPVNTAESTTGWTEMTGRTSGGAATQEDRAFIQESYSVSQSTGAATGRTVGLQYDYGSNITWTSGFVFLMWQYWMAPKAIGTWADGGMRIGIGSAAGNVKLWNAHGNDYGRNPYGGWDCVAIDPTYAYDEIIGTPTTGNYRIFCSAPYLLQAVSKGNPHCVDAIRYGRGQLKIEYGATVDGYGTFAGMASANDADAARWGLFSYQSGSYIWKGLLSFGTATNAVDFRDANRNIAIADTPRTYAAFNKIEINNASSRVDWTAIQIYSLGTLSKGTFSVINNADVNFESCVFTDMLTFVFQSNSTILSTIFRRCGQITQDSATFTGCKFESCTDTISLLCNNPSAVTGCTFTSDGGNHALELTTACAGGTYSLTGHTFTGYDTSDGTTNAVIHNNSNGAVTLNVSGITGTISVKNTGSSTTSLVTSSVNCAINVKDVLTGANIQTARVLVMANTGGPMPYQASVTIARVTSTATVTHSGHGLVTNNKVLISGANQIEYNGVHTITYISSTQYSFAVTGTPDTPATGTIKSTFVLIDGDTDSSGNISYSKSYTSSQPITGRVRKFTTGAYYKTSPITGTVDSVNGVSIVVQLIPDV
jgi:hypothetical protein